MPKILIDEGLASYGKMSGIGYHIVNLSEHLKEISECKITKYKILRKIPRYFRKWAYIGVSNIADLYSNYDLVHHMANYIPLIRGKNKHIVTIYDLSVLRYQETISLAWRHYNQIALKNAIKRADGIIAISNSIRNELLENFPELDRNNIYVCPTGLRKTLIESVPAENNLLGLKLKPFSYFLFVSDLTKRKNLKFLLSTFINAKERGILQESTKLILVGKRAWGYNEFSSMLKEEMGIREMGYLTDEQVVALYHYSKAFVYPSIYEGFGMPIIEAMSQKVPIIISNIPTNMELNNAHNNQMFSFEIGDSEELIKLFGKFDREFHSIRERLNYGDLLQYHYSSVAMKHLSIYSAILNK